MFNHREVVKLARKAVAHGRRNDWGEAGEAVGEIRARYGIRGIHILMLGCADTVLIHLNKGKMPPKEAIVIPVWFKPSGEVIDDPDQVIPSTRWAGRFIAARGAQDLDGCNALLESIPDDVQFLENVYALVDVAATTLNHLYGPPEGVTNGNNGNSTD